MSDDRAARGSADERTQTEGEEALTIALGISGRERAACAETGWPSRKWRREFAGVASTVIANAASGAAYGAAAARRLAVAARPVPRDGEHDRGRAEGVEGHDVDEQAPAKPADRARDRPGTSATTTTVTSSRSGSAPSNRDPATTPTWSDRGDEDQRRDSAARRSRRRPAV